VWVGANVDVVLKGRLQQNAARYLNRVVQLDCFFRTERGKPYASSSGTELIADFAVYDAEREAIMIPVRNDPVVAEPSRDLLILLVYLTSS
jgi:hypothetical protein